MPAQWQVTKMDFKALLYINIKREIPEENQLVNIFGSKSNDCIGTLNIF